MEDLESQHMAVLAPLHLSVAVPIAIERLRARGGPTDKDHAWAQRRLGEIQEAGAGHAVTFYDKGKTKKEMVWLTDVLAILAFVPGGVQFAGQYFDAHDDRTCTLCAQGTHERIQPRDYLLSPQALDDLIAELDALGIDYDDHSRHPDTVTPEEKSRIDALFVEVMQASDAGNAALVAQLEAELDTLLLQPTKVEVV